MWEQPGGSSAATPTLGGHARAWFLLGEAEGPQEQPAQRGLRGSGHCDQQPARHCSRLSLGSKPPVKGAEQAS